MTSARKTEAQKLRRLPHAGLDRDTRIAKAQKLLSIIGQERLQAARTILEVGCGAGVITSVLARLDGSHAAVHAVDVVDTRIERDGYDFQLVSGTALPYSSASFDIVISNHVVEHVGDQDDQLHHLQELRRVVRPGGIVYFAVPNRWRLIEPHFHLPFLSWFPRRLSDRYVRMMGKGTHYDCTPPSYRRISKLFRSAGFTVEDQTIHAVRETLQTEMQGAAPRLLNRVLPDWAPQLMMPIMPTYIFLLMVGDASE